MTAEETVAFSLWDVYQRAGPAFFFIIIILKQRLGFPGRLLTAPARLRKSSGGRDELRLTSQRTVNEPHQSTSGLGEYSQSSRPTG